MKEINNKYMVDEYNYRISPYSNKKKYMPYLRQHDEIEEVIIHCTAAGNEKWEDPITCINYDLNPNHISRSGLATATYHFYINQKGEIYQLVSMNMQTAHCAGHNRSSIAVCINHDGFTPEEITEKMYSSLIETICYIFDFTDWGYDEHGVRDRLQFHRDYANKACPGRLSKESLIVAVAERLKTWGDNA